MAEDGNCHREIYSREESCRIEGNSVATVVTCTRADEMNGNVDDDALARDAGSDIRLENVESMDLGAVFDFLEDRQVPCSGVMDLEEMRDLVRRTLKQEYDNEPSGHAAGADDDRVSKIEVQLFFKKVFIILIVPSHSV